VARRELQERVAITGVGCLGPCSQGPLLAVDPDGALFAGVTAADFVPIQAAGQQRLWRETGASPNRDAVEAAIRRLQAADPGFSMAGASWTNNLSWVEGYANVLEPMNQLSAAFHQRFDPLLARDPAISLSQPYQEALLALLLLETSCFRYWGQGIWTEYAREIHRRGEASVFRAP
jgi:hypothetical protein